MSKEAAGSDRPPAAPGQGEEPGATNTQGGELQREVEALRSRLSEATTLAEALHKISERIAAAPPLDEIVDFIADKAVQVTGAEVCLFYVLDREREELVLMAAKNAAEGLVGRLRMKFGEGVTGWVAKEQRPVVLPSDAPGDPRFKYVPELRDDLFQSMLSVPVISKGELLGVINLRTRAPHSYTEEQIRIVSAIASPAAIAIERAMLQEGLERRASQLSTVSEVSKTTTSDLYLEDVLRLIVAMTAETFRFKICTIMLLDEDRQELVIKATQSDSREYIGKPNLKLGESLAGQAALERKHLAVLDVTSTPGYRYPDIAQREGLKSLICVPMMMRDRVVGVLNCYTSHPHRFRPEEVALLTTVANHAALAIVNAQLSVKAAVAQEMHHRIKNNLQTVASLLRLQLSHQRTQSVEHVLQQSINRILSIAAVHDILSKGDIDLIDVRQVGRTLLDHAAASLLPPGHNVEFLIDGPPLRLPAQKATSLALVLSELIQNAVEHGLAGQLEGQVIVAISRMNNSLCLEVANDGVPLPDGFDLRSSANLGLRIVERLVREDLGGEFTIASEPRTTMRVVFPRREGGEQSIS